MKIDQLINLGVIPHDIPDNIIISICINIGITNYNKDTTVFNQTQLERLLYSKELNEFKTKSIISNQHQSVIDKYTELINNYKKILNDIAGLPEFASERNSINNLITNLTTERDSYQRSVNGFGLNNVSQYFNNTASNKVEQVSNNLFKQAAQSNEQQMNIIDNQLNRLYRKVDVLNSNNGRTISGKLKNSIRIKKTLSQINRLKNKQGRLRNHQSRIVGLNTSMYVNKMNRKFEKYFKELNQINDMVEDKKYLIREQEEVKVAQQEAMQEHALLQANMLNSNMFQRAILNAKSRKSDKHLKQLQEHIRKLQNKIGSVDISQQYSEVFNRNYAR